LVKGGMATFLSGFVLLLLYYKILCQHCIAVAAALKLLKKTRVGTDYVQIHLQKPDEPENQLTIFTKSLFTALFNKF
jgi:hypothetical protein